MRIVQISDIHLSNDNLTDFKAFFLEGIIKDLTEFNREKKIDLIVLTGDLLDKGGESFANPSMRYELFETEFINPILKALSLSKIQVLFIPGNHDIDRSEIDVTYEKGLVTEIISISTANVKLAENLKKFTLINNRIQRFKEFEKSFHASTPNYFYSNNQSYFIYKEQEIKIGFLLVNDSWRCSNGLKTDQHFIGTNQLLEAKTFFESENTNFNIVLFHHPLELLNDDEQQELRNIINKWDFELVLYGHTHSASVAHTHGINGNAVFLNPQTAFNNPRTKISEFEPGYNIIDIDLNNLNLTCFFRKYIHARFEFDADTNAAAGGTYNTRLVPKGEKADYYDLYQLASKTVDSHLVDFNNSLLIYKTNSIAPSDIKELFVLPKLSDQPSDVSAEKDEKIYSLSGLLVDPKNILLLGEKESGKTTLLNRLSIEISNGFSNYKKIPVYFDYKKLVKNDVLTLIRKYLNESEAKVIQMAGMGQLILLIDNYDGTPKLKISANYLDYFLKQFPETKIILTTSSTLEKLMQFENDLLNKWHLKAVFIGSVGVPQFKELASVWFKNKDAEWHYDNIERLIKVFKILRIPRTFFSISLYLWVIEKQESFKPLNKSYLLNKFLQLILEGLIAIEGKAGSFNFDRKKEILAEIALEMFKSGNVSGDYSLAKEVIILSIKVYVTKNQRSFEADEAFDLFLDRGIFKLIVDEENDKYSFRFESFFQFFLSYNIDNHPEFKEKVLSKEEILSFIDELEYYSGRNQNSKELLEHTTKLLNESFQNIDSVISDETDTYAPKKFVLLDKINHEMLATDLEKSGMDEKAQEKEFDKQLKNLPVSESINIKKKYDYRLDFPLCLELTARILKNAENIQDPILINQSLDLIVQKAAKFGIYIQSLISFELQNNSRIDSPFPLDIVLLFEPLLNQSNLLQWMGTDFLHIPLKAKIENYLNRKKEDQKQSYEQFLSVFIYVDLKLPNYLEILKKATKNIDNKYFAELYFFRILLVYKFSPSKSELRPKLHDILTNLLVKIKGTTRQAASERLDQQIKSMPGTDVSEV